MSVPTFKRARLLHVFFKQKGKEQVFKDCQYSYDSTKSSLIIKRGAFPEEQLSRASIENVYLGEKNAQELVQLPS